MKFYFGPYLNWVGPYQIAGVLKHFGVSEDKCHEYGEWLADNTPLSKWCNYLYDKQKQNIKVKLDDWDVWNADYTLSHVIVPVLEKIRDLKHGTPGTDDEDVPEELRSTSAPPKEKEWDLDANWEKRWEWILGEMIWAFKSVRDADEHEPNFNHNDLKKYQEESKIFYDRQSNGLRLFGKYYRALWT